MMRVKIKNEVPPEEDGSLYNIYTISFNNIKGPASIIENGRQLKRLQRLEERAYSLIEEVNYMVGPQMYLMRRSFTHSVGLQWIYKTDDGERHFVSLNDERVTSYLSSLVGEMLKRVTSYETEVMLLNANFKIEWLRYFEHCRISNSMDEFIAPKDFLERTGLKKMFG